MALKERHWILGTLLACAAIAVLELPPDGRATRTRWRPTTTPESRARDRLRDHLRRETSTLALLTRRDSVLGTPAHARREDRIHLRFDADVPSALRGAIEHEISRELGALGGQALVAPVIVRVLADTGARLTAWGSGYVRASWLESEYVLPPATDGHTCIAFIRVGERLLDDAGSERGRVALERAVERHAGRVLGPCGFYGAHGLPGPAIEAWLSAAHFGPALRAPAPGSDSLWNPFGGTEPSLSPRVMWLLDRTMFRPTLVRCAEGSTDACAAALQATRRDSLIRRSPWLPRDDAPRLMSRSSLGPAEAWLLAGVHERLGPDAFGRFWRSAASPDSALRDVTGVTLSEATRDWARATYAATPRGSWPSPVALAGQLLLAGALVGLAALRRRC